MTVFTWQLLVATSTFSIIFIKGKAAWRYVTGFWVLWTIIKLHSELMFFQLGNTAFFTWLAFKAIDATEANKLSSSDRKKLQSQRLIIDENRGEFEREKAILDREREELERQKAILKKEYEEYEKQRLELEVRVRQLLKEAEEDGNMKPISDDQHNKVLLDALALSEHTLCILSGWISQAVVNRRFLKLLESALNRGVNVYIGYGYVDSKGVHHHRKNTDNALYDLYRLMFKYRTKNKGNLFIGRYSNHEKMLVLDEKYVICGSYNWLSNHKAMNKERSYRYKSTKVAILETSRITKMVTKHQKC